MRIIAGIGSRKTPIEIQDIMYQVGYSLAKAGRMLYSGGAESADSSFQDGVEAFCNEAKIESSQRQRIFLPKAYFKGLKADGNRGIVNFLDTNNKDKAIALAKKFYIIQEKSTLKGWPEWMENYMGRNCYQILGESLDKPINAVICWTKDGSTDGSQRSSGGTGQALRLAKHYNIPVFNLQREKHLEFIKNTVLDNKLKI